MAGTIDGDGAIMLRCRIEHRGGEILQRAEGAVNEQDRPTLATVEQVHAQIINGDELADGRKVPLSLIGQDGGRRAKPAEHREGNRDQSEKQAGPPEPCLHRYAGAAEADQM